MRKKIFYISVLSFFTYTLITSFTSIKNSMGNTACEIYGKIKIVDYGEDLKVKWVDYGEDSKGKWKKVDYGQKFKIKFVDYGEDFKIKEVDYGEGC